MRPTLGILLLVVSLLLDARILQAWVCDQSCAVKIDVVLVLDGSGSIDATEFASLRQFALDLVNLFHINVNEVNVGIVLFDDTAVNILSLSSDKPTIVNKLTTMTPGGGRTNTQAAIALGRQLLDASVRNPDQQIMIVVTDGNANRCTNCYGTDALSAAIIEATSYRNSSPKRALWGIAVGNEVDQQFINSISTPGFTFSVSDFSKLSNILQQLIDMFCYKPPTITKPADITVQCNTNTDPAHTGGAATASGWCHGCPPTLTGPTDTFLPGSCPQAKTIVRTWFAKDECGRNTTAVQKIYVVDTIKPVLTVPPDVNSECSDKLTPADCGYATATDNCDPHPNVTYSDQKIPGSTPGSYIIKRTWTATDACGNSVSGVQNIVVGDTHAPVLTVPADCNVECPQTPSVANCGTASAVDNCDSHPNVTYSDYITSGRCAGYYTIKRTWTATDAAGNSYSKYQTINVRDTHAPVLTIPPICTVECPNTPSLASCGTATARDDCDPHPNVTYHDEKTAGTCPGTYTIKRTWTATDACGNSASQYQLIKVVDTTAPVLYAPPDVTVECSGSLNPLSCGDARAVDSCDPSPKVTYTDEYIRGDCPGSYTIKRTWVATDCSGNTVSKCQVITVQDTKAPNLRIPNDITVECGSAVLDLNKCGNATATDYCDPHPKITYSDRYIYNSICSSLYTIERTWTATDCCGNSVSKRQLIRVVDTIPPVLTVPSDRTVQCPAGTDLIQCGDASAHDQCDPNPKITHVDVVVNGSCGNYTIKRTFTATDCAGNSASKSQTIYVVDNVPPVITDIQNFCLWPPNHKFYCISGFCNSDLVTAYDQCSSKTFVRFNGCSYPSSNQPENGLGDGNTQPDCTYDSATDTLCLRAERAGPLTDRVYQVSISVSDSSNAQCGNVAYNTLTVTVPHDQSDPRYKKVCRSANTN